MVKRNKKNKKNIKKRRKKKRTGEERGGGKLEDSEFIGKEEIDEGKVEVNVKAT